MRQTACMVVNPITVDYLLNCIKYREKENPMLVWSLNGREILLRKDDLNVYGVNE